ncbi:unnamed protein product [Cochlearia groenlandica]
MFGFLACGLSELVRHIGSYLGGQADNIFSWLGGEAKYIFKLERNLADLDASMEKLRARRGDVLTMVQNEENRGLQRLNEVQVWLTSVEDIQNQVCELLLPRTDELERLCLCGLCTKDPTLSYIYGRRVFNMLQEVADLRSEGVFQVVAGPPTVPAVVEWPLDPKIFGQNEMLESAWNQLKNDETGSMGLYGMGGVGKTTLLKQINNRFLRETLGFEFVISVVVSSNPRVEKIQDEIGGKLGFGDQDWKQKEERHKADDINTRLRNKRFVLLLDDIWKEVNLAEIGVPYPTTENKCKVVFTTRSKEVCGQMGVGDPMEVKILDSDEAWKLFRSRVGNNTLESHPDIIDLACKVARECCGLPLALNIIGKNMASKRTVEEWRRAIETLASSAAKFPGMKEDILPILKYSYDSLKEDNHVKSCFQYCALFPEDSIIEKDELVDYWICEGLIDEKQGRKRASDEAHEIIGTLVRACLLIEEEKEDKSYVKMHDVVRDLALWIASDFGEHKERCIVHARVGLREAPTVENWGSVTRISLMGNQIENIWDSPQCPQLTTLLLQNNELLNISAEFFKSMPMPTTATCRLTKVKDADIFEFGGHANREYFWDIKFVEFEDTETSTYPNVVVDQLSDAPGVANAIVWLIIGNVKEKSALTFPDMAVLSYLRIHRSEMGEIIIKKNPTSPCFPNLSTLQLARCNGVKDLTCLLFAPNLNVLFVYFSNQIEDIISKEKAADIVTEVEVGNIIPFRKLERLEVYELPKLKSIYWSSLPFPCLRKFHIGKCPNLRKLPLNSNSGSSIVGKELVIYYGEQYWTDKVEWEDNDTKERFLNSMKPWE